MKTYPNQKIVKIKKEKYNSNFLQIGIDEWQGACKKLSGSGFKLYLYLASNANNYDLALSAKDVEESVGISHSSYKNAVQELINTGYLEFKTGNLYFFYCNGNKQKEEEIEEEIEEQEETKNYIPTEKVISVVNWKQKVNELGKEIDRYTLTATNEEIIEIVKLHEEIENRYPTKEQRQNNAKQIYYQLLELRNNLKGVAALPLNR